MEKAYGACLEMLLVNIRAQGYSDDELKQYDSSLKSFIKDKKVAEELLNAIREPGRDDLPSPDVLRERWNEVGGDELPSDAIWDSVAIAFRRQATKRIILSDDLRELLNAQNLQESAQNLHKIKQLIERTTGVVVEVQQDKYYQRMRTKFSPVDLANLMPAYAEDPGRMVIRDVFVAQNVRENPPPVEIPKDLAERLRKGGRHEASGDAKKDLDEKQLEKLGAAYVSQSPKPVLDVIAAAGNRLLVLTGEPGSGKTTLMRYLLTGIIEPPVDRKSAEPLPWTLPFKDAFPLLIELRDFYALRRTGECDSFLEYVAYMGKTDQWFLDDQAVHGYLETGASLVMFDGLDEIFDTADRERVMQEIAGFAQRYPRARIIVTSRPVGYKERVLRDAGFTHFGLQDLTDEQIETFIRGWFALTFPQQPQQADQRIERLLGSVRQSKPIRLLAGNPMLLTIMALLAREQELPRERAKFYEKAVEVLCHHWDANRNLELPEDRYLNADDKKALLRRIAMRMQAGEAGLKGNIIGGDDLEHEIQAFLLDEQLKANPVEAKQAARGLIEQLHERNYILCLRGPHLYGFVHRTFLEYLTAAEYVRRFDKQPQQMTIDELIDLFDQHCTDDDWREVLRLICGQIDEQFVGRIVEHLATQAESKMREDGLILAMQCLSEGRNRVRLRESEKMVLAIVLRLATKASADPFWQGYASGFTIVLPSSEAWFIRYVWAEFASAVSLSKENVNMPSITEFGSFGMAISNDALQTVRLTLMEDIAGRGTTDSLKRAGALQGVSEHWPDNTTRKLIKDRAVKDEMVEVRRAALQALGEKWPDETTRKLLAARAVQDRDSGPRSAALQALAKKWSDETTRKLLAERAVQDDHKETRSAALRCLAKKWPDETTRKLLAQRAFDASLTPEQRCEHCVALGKMHSEFGRIVFTQEVDGWEPYLDPAKPVSRKHIKRAAKEADVPADKIDETVRSLSAHMDWDITKGAAG